MTYKIKSLIYFSCFLTASFAYYIIEKHDEFQNQMQSKTYVEAEFKDMEIPLEEEATDLVLERK
ncbi:hypothetical protein [Flagellimonas meishanensis]|uniref:hypothetical protein n=1 Tax=Flagellimonas meishanensis TaxID=2873264 RepID=UPI001CA6ED2B|nr:hypothetical protein [[Muricauda] meishanensis]